MIDDHLKPEGRKNQDIVTLILDMIDKQEDSDSFKLNMDNLKAIVMVNSQILVFFISYVNLY